MADSFVPLMHISIVYVGKGVLSFRTPVDFRDFYQCECNSTCDCDEALIYSWPCELLVLIVLLLPLEGHCSLFRLDP